MESKDKIKLLEKIYEEIQNSQQYKGLEKKTQVLNKGVSNPELELTTRATHTEQVRKNATKLATEINLPEEDVLISRIIGLSHDIGHVAFGHDGEFAISKCVKEKGKSGFEHSQYGGAILKKLMQEYLSKRVSKGLLSKEEYDYINEVYSQIKKGIENHDQYYVYAMTDKEARENPALASGRLADSLSFMVSDLSDLTRAGIIKGESIDDLADRIGLDKSIVEEIKSLLGEGKSGVLKIQEKIIEEVASKTNTKNLSIPEGITDQYKLLREINSCFESLDTRKDIDKDTLTLMHKLGEYIKCCEFDKVDTGLSDKIEESIKNNNSSELLPYIDTIRSMVNTRTAQEKQQLQWETPTLSVTFELQDELQYNQILYRDTSILDNDSKRHSEAISILFNEYYEESQKGSVDRNSVVDFTGDEHIDYAISKIHSLSNDDVILYEQELEKKSKGLVIDREAMKLMYDSITAEERKECMEMFKMLKSRDLAYDKDTKDSSDVR